MMTVQRKKGFLYSRVVAENEFVERLKYLKIQNSLIFFVHDTQNTKLGAACEIVKFIINKFYQNKICIQY